MTYIKDKPSTADIARWAEEDKEQAAFEAIGFSAGAASVTVTRTCLPRDEDERIERDYKLMEREFPPYYDEDGRAW